MAELERDFKANGGEFREFRIGDLFEIYTGSLLDIKNIKYGGIPRISVKSDENGILGYYDTLNFKEARHYENFISVNFFGNAFYHPYIASIEMKVHVLKLRNFEFDRYSGLYFSSLINKFFNGCFSYGNQLSSSKLKNNNFFISVPCDSKGNIAFHYMESYIRELEALRLSELEAYLAATGLKDYELNQKDKDALAKFDRMTNGGGMTD